MRSNSDRISRREELSDLFEQLGKRLHRAISLLVIIYGWNQRTISLIST